jgi:hypothetical protein
MTTSELKAICAAIFLVGLLAPTTSARAVNAVTLHLSRSVTATGVSCSIQ